MALKYKYTHSRVLLFRVLFTNELLRKGVNISLFLPYHQIIDLQCLFTTFGLINLLLCISPNFILFFYLGEDCYSGIHFLLGLN